MMGVSGVELAAVIRQLRAELNEALVDAEGERLQFELGTVEISLTVTVGRGATPGAKIRSGSSRQARMSGFPVNRSRISSWYSLRGQRAGLCHAMVRSRDGREKEQRCWRRP